MATPKLVKPERASFSEAWTSESEFTAWLANEDGIELLSEALGIDLEPVAKEQAIGCFRADLVCRDVNDGTPVIVENQVGQSDHCHLGQALTYSAGTEPGTIVWIAGSFRDEHRAAVDRYNEVTNEQVRFFALEIEVYKVGDGKVAPRFNVVSRPNDWRKVVSVQNEDAGEPRRGFDSAGFWDRVNSKIETRHGIVKPIPTGRWYAHFGTKLSNQFRLGASFNVRKGQLRVDFNVQGRNKYAHASQLLAQRDEIEQEVGHTLNWDLVEDGSGGMIYLDRFGVDLNDASQLDEYAEWIAENLGKLRRAFWDRVDDLNPEACA